jgi:hypothetical protein
VIQLEYIKGSPQKGGPQKNKSITIVIQYNIINNSPEKEESPQREENLQTEKKKVCRKRNQRSKSPERRTVSKYMKVTIKKKNPEKSPENVKGESPPEIGSPLRIRIKVPRRRLEFPKEESPIPLSRPPAAPRSLLAA